MPTTVLTSIHGRLLGVSPVDGSLWSNGRMIVPGPGNPFPRVALKDDFLGDVVADQWTYTEGTDSSTADGAIVAGAIGGVFRLTGGDSAGSVAADGAQLNSYLQWQASNGGLAFEARVALASIAAVSCFVGFTDTTSLEQPVESSGSANGLTTNATDAVGFMFDTRMDTDEWWAVGVANDVDAACVATGVAPVASTFARLRVEIDATGTATFSINGVVKARLAGCLTPATDLTPCFIIRPTTAAAGKTMDIDYVAVEMDR
jgi:hypothetical protein